MSSLSEIRQAIKTTLQPVLPQYEIYPNVPEQVNTPSIVIDAAGCDFSKAFGRGMDEWQFELVILLARADVDSAYAELDKVASGGGSASIRQHIFNNHTLGLDDTDSFVSGVKGYGRVSDLHITATVLLTVITDGST